MSVSHETARGGDSCDDDADFRATLALLRYHLQNNDEEPDEEQGVVSERTKQKNHPLNTLIIKGVQ